MADVLLSWKLWNPALWCDGSIRRATPSWRVRSRAMRSHLVAYMARGLQNLAARIHPASTVQSVIPTSALTFECANESGDRAWRVTIPRGQGRVLVERWGEADAVVHGTKQ